MSSFNHKYHHVVFGYIRDIQESLPYKTNTFFTIPPTMSIIVLSYFQVMEEWSKELKSEKIIIDYQNRNKICRSTLANTSGFSSIYGNNICEYNNYYHWKFKILAFSDSEWSIWIGLTKEEKCRQIVGNGFITGNGAGCAWVITKPSDSNSLIRSSVAESRYGSPIQNGGDIVDMIFDFHDNASLSYKVNHTPYGL
eukprot:UN06557